MFVLTFMRMFVPPFMIQLPPTFQVELEAIRMLAANPLLFDVVSVPPLKVKIELVGAPQARLVTKIVCTVMEPPAFKTFVPPAPAWAPMIRLVLGEKMEPLTVSVPPLMTVPPL